MHPQLEISSDSYTERLDCSPLWSSRYVSPYRNVCFKRVDCSIKETFLAEAYNIVASSLEAKFYKSNQEKNPL